MLEVPEATIPFSDVLRGVPDGGRYWAMRGSPQRGSKVEVFYASWCDDDDGSAPVIGIDYVAGRWELDQDFGEEEWYEVDEATEEFQVDELLWREVEGKFPYGSMVDYTVCRLMGRHPDT